MKRVALVTGASGGIGRETAQAFAAAGWEVIGVDRQPQAEFENPITTRTCDVSKPEAIEALFEWFSDRWDHLDALVNNAAIQITKPLVEMQVQEWDAVLDSNLRSVFLTCRSGFHFLKAAQGAIVNVASVHAVATSANIAAYAASKGGMVALTRAMAIEFAPDSIRANAVLPGAVDTPMLRAGLQRGHVSGGTVEERLADLGRKTVLGRVGRPEEIAQTILFLADSQQSAFVTGQAWIIDGGATARLSTE